MKKIIILCGILILLTGCKGQMVSSGNTKQQEEILRDNFKINTKEKGDCNQEIVEYYSNGNQKVYLVCLDEVKINIQNKEMTLKKYLKEYGIDSGMNEIFTKLKIENALNDGGTAIYRDKEPKQYSNNGIMIVKCKTVRGNNDVYIGKADLDYYWGFTNGFCGHYS